MPFTDYGIRPDIIINPHAIPSRMTIGQLLETVMGKACSIYGAFGDCTAFVNKGPKHKIFGELLVNEGFHSSGNELLYNGQTGEQLEAQIFMGPTYYMRLKHMVKDKINYRAKGPRTVLTRQTVQGRANDGGLRIGEMERDGLIAHGITNFLKESMLVRGDDYYMAICNKTGTIAVYNSSSNIFISPFADGPLKYTESLDTQTLNIENVTRFGRSFSIIRVPYAFKLLYQELQTMNIQMRIITEDNIDQLAPMSFSNSKENTVKNVKNVYEGIRKYMQRKEKQKKALPALPAPPKELSAIEQAAKSAMALFYPQAAPEVKANLPSPQEYYGNVPVFYDSATGKYEKYVSPESVEKGVAEKVTDFADSSLASVSQMADTAKMSAQQVIDSVSNTKNTAFNLADQAKTSALNQMNATANSVTGFADSSLASVTQIADTAKMSAQQVMNGVSSAKDSALTIADQAKTSVINQMNATTDSLKNNVSNARAYASNTAADASAKATDFVASTSAKATDFVASTSAKATDFAASTSAKATSAAADASAKASGIAADASAKASDLAAKTSARATTLAKAANDLASSLSAQASNMSASLAENTGTQFSNFKEYMNTTVIEPLSLLTTIQPEKTSGGGGGGGSDAGVTKTVRM